MYVCTGGIDDVHICTYTTVDRDIYAGKIFCFENFFMHSNFHCQTL